MFIGSWAINISFSVIAFLFVFIGSMSTNSLLTSSFRGGLAFLFFYVVMYLFRWVWMLALAEEKEIEFEEKVQIEESHLGKDTNMESFTDEDIAKASQYVKDLINE